MSVQTEAARAAAPASRPRSFYGPFYWSVRRELWENRSIVIAPLAAAGVVLLGFLLTLFGLKQEMSSLTALTPMQQSVELAHEYGKALAPVWLAAFLVAVFYCLDALHGERRDRSILFWKSLPVSDLTTVLSKAAIPLLVLPLLVFAIVAVEQLLFIVLDSLFLLGSGFSSAPLWTQPPLIPMLAQTLYGFLAAAWWQAPLYAWLLLISAWARRSTFLWAVLPPLGLCALEAIVFKSGHFASLLFNRLVGWFDAGFISPPEGAEALMRSDPLGLLGSAGFWLGLLAAAGMLAAAVRLRRYRQPI